MIKRFPFIELILYGLLTYPLFYYAYKFSSPEVGGLKDYFSYYFLYKDWNFSEVDSPFNQRVISSFFIYLFHKIGFSYETDIVYTTDFADKKIYFNAIFFNYLSFLASCLVIYKTVARSLNNTILAFSSGVLYALGFGTLFFNLNGLTESFSLLLAAVMFYYYLNKSHLILIPIILAVFQREYLFFVFGLIALMDYLFEEKNKYYLQVLLYTVMAFVLYYILRKTFFYTPRYEAQLSVVDSLLNLFNPRFPLGDYIKQTFLIQNILFVYLLTLAYKKWNKWTINHIDFYKVLALFMQANFISLMAVLGNSTGRYFYLTMPIVIFMIAKEIKPIFIKLNQN
jgi:hypothetical protein